MSKTSFKYAIPRVTDIAVVDAFPVTPHWLIHKSTEVVGRWTDRWVVTHSLTAHAACFCESKVKATRCAKALQELENEGTLDFVAPNLMPHGIRAKAKGIVKQLIELGEAIDPRQG